MDKQPFTIALEGIDNCGKTTMASKLVACLVDKGYNVYVSKELTTPIGRYIRNSFPGNAHKLSPLMKAFLFAADRLVRYENMAGEKYDVVIWDRYVFSAIVYRVMEGLDGKWVRHLNSIFPKADLTFYLDVDIGESLSRGRRARKPCLYNRGQLDTCLNLYRKFCAQEHFISLSQMSQEKTLGIALKRILNELN